MRLKFSVGLEVYIQAIHLPVANKSWSFQEKKRITQKWYSRAGSSSDIYLYIPDDFREKFSPSFLFFFLYRLYKELDFILIFVFSKI